MDDVVKQIALGTGITVVSGVDDVCLGLEANKQAVCQHASMCAQHRINANDNAALEEMARVLGIPALKTGDRLVLDAIKIRKIRAHIAAKDNHRVCSTCAWHGLCQEILMMRFLLLPPFDGGRASFLFAMSISQGRWYYSTCPLMRLAKDARKNMSMSPSKTACDWLVSAPVRASLTI